MRLGIRSRLRLFEVGKLVLGYPTSLPSWRWKRFWISTPLSRTRRVMADGWAVTIRTGGREKAELPPVNFFFGPFIFPLNVGIRCIKVTPLFRRVNP
jgi:hypothetical protein